MRTISFRISDDEARLIKEYTNVNNLYLSNFVRELLLDKIEENLPIDEARILHAKALISQEEVLEHQEVWNRLGI